MILSIMTVHSQIENKSDAATKKGQLKSQWFFDFTYDPSSVLYNLVAENSFLKLQFV